MDILELENKIIQLRMELNDHIRQAGNLTGLEKLKIQAMQQDLQLLQSELNILKNSQTPSVSQPVPVFQTQSRPIPAFQAQPQPGSAFQPQMQPQPVERPPYHPQTQTPGSYNIPPYANVPTYVNQSSYPDRKAPDYEKVFGKAVMSIFASILIFISMIIFGTLVIPRLADVIKLVILYTSSICVSVLGLILLKKDGKNKLYQAVAGCGVGAVYISLFLSNLYFKAIGDTVLYAGLFLWAVLLCFLARKKSLLFQIIGQLGVIIAAQFGCVHYIIPGERLNLILVLVFFTLTEIIYIAAFHKERMKIDAVQIGISIFGAMYVFTHLIAAIGRSPIYPPEGVIVPSCIVGLFLCVCILYMTFTLENEEKNRIFQNVFMALDLYLAWGLLARYKLLFAGAVLVIFLCYLYKTSSYKLNFDLFSLFHAAAFLAAFQSVTLFSAGCMAAAAAALIFSGIRFRRTDLKIYGFFGLFAWLAQLPINNIAGREAMAVTCLITGSLLCILLPLIIFFCRKPDTTTKEEIGLHITAYCFELLFIWRGILTIGALLEIKFRTHPFTSDALSWLQNPYIKLLCASFTAFLLNTACRQFLKHRAKENRSGKKALFSEGKTYLNAVYIINIFFMLLGYFIIYQMKEHMFSRIAAALFLSLTFLFNLKNVSKLQYGKLYIGIKFLFLMLILLNIFDAANYLVSICCFAFACTSIFIGFKIQFKSVRLFGLILSCMAAAKLVLLDIHYTSSGLKAASFFICGIICFLIALIYNAVDKKQTKDTP